MDVVDFGCGAGSLTCGFARLIAPGKVLGLDTSEDAIGRARALAEQAGLDNARFLVADINQIELPPDSFDVAHFSGVLMYLSTPEHALRLAFRSLKSGGMVAACESHRAGDWAAGPNADSAMLVARLFHDENEARGGDPLIGGRLRALVREVGFECVVSQPGYSAAHSDVQSMGATLRGLMSGNTRCIPIRRGLTAERCDQLIDEISIWAASEDSISAFAQCAVIGWKP
jgi:SAM-dependent methyltransferase